MHSASHLSSFNSPSSSITETRLKVGMPSQDFKHDIFAPPIISPDFVPSTYFNVTPASQAPVFGSMGSPTAFKQISEQSSLKIPKSSNSNSTMRHVYVRRLDTPGLILDALGLLYEVYIEHQHWEFSRNNPSELQVIMRYGRQILIDRFTETSIWFGAFHRDQLIGVTRLCGVDMYGKFEVEGYPSSYPIQEFLLDKHQKCFEVSRMAIRREYAGQGVAKKLFLAIFEYSTTMASSIFTCTANASLILFYSHIGWPPIKERAFKYELHDPEPVNFYFASYDSVPEKCEVERMIRNLSQVVYSQCLSSSKL